ncbi:WYL domain-containing protein [Scytonema sp. UIC 10036]|uniref:helix-turn-helix transcriptional regulator n=1 Tax=Scytonema sp. UIC 10036 TaxID=2304196 RepID=UPI0012DA5461|nr:WYL domain-containing protein [Scytonema sp. UIC 10036]MUH00297.1 WYL domain-containing protein [Scytonema sp. UIC 10036]
MPPKVDASNNQLAFALEILRLLAEKPRRRDELTDLLSIFLEQHGQSIDNIDVKQKLTRAIRKLRDCGIEIRSGTHSPYELVESKFPLLLSTEQRSALAIAVYFLSDMGFSAQASQIQRIGNLSESDIPAFVKLDFSPPVDYSDRNLDKIVRQLQERFQQQCRYTIRYQSKPGEGRIWDIDRSELRLHDGVLYLFAFIPDWRSWQFDHWHNIDQNHIFRLDRIVNVGAASDTRWVSCDFPKLKVRYRTSGKLANYKPRRKDEVIVCSDPEGKFREIEATIDYWFWFRQRILKYGESAQLLSPQKLADEMKKEYQKIWEKLSADEN